MKSCAPFVASEMRLRRKQCYFCLLLFKEDLQPPNLDVKRVYQKFRNITSELDVVPTDTGYDVNSSCGIVEVCHLWRFRNYVYKSLRNTLWKNGLALKACDSLDDEKSQKRFKVRPKKKKVHTMKWTI